MLVEFTITDFKGQREKRCYEVRAKSDSVVASDVDADCHVGQWPTMDGFWEFVKIYMRGTDIVVVEGDAR